MPAKQEEEIFPERKTDVHRKPYDDDIWDIIHHKETYRPFHIKHFFHIKQQTTTIKHENVGV